MKYRFFFHYRRQTGNMTIHFRGQCLPCKAIICRVPVETKWNKRQPRLVMQGFASGVDVKNGKAVIA